MSWHDAETVGSIHVPYNWTYANAAARTGASGFVAGDVGKFARQTDDNSIWMLTAITPTWVEVGSGGSVPAHASNHENGGSDEISVAGLSGELADDQPPKTHAIGGVKHAADTLANLNSKVSDATLDDSGDPRDPNAHASSHQSGGSDAIRLDDLAAPNDNTDLDATTSAHGLLPKLGGGTTDFLRADGSWSEPTGVDEFTGLTDTPSNYSGQAGKVATVNSGESALEFADAGGKLSKIFQGIDTTGGMTITNVAQVIELDHESIKDDYYTHSTTVNPGEVTILQTGWYKITAMMTVASVSSSGGMRGNPVLNIQVDSGSGFVAQPDKMGGYVREDTSNELSTSVTGVGYFYFTANDKIRLTVHDTVTNEPDEETIAYSQRLIIEYEDRSGTGGTIVNNLKDVGDVDAAAPPGGAKLFFNDTTSKWEDEDLPILRYNEVISEDWAPTWAELYAHGPVIFGNTSLALTGFVGNATVATLNGLSPTANDSYLVTDSGTLTAGSVVVTAGALVVYNGSVWVLVTSGVGGYAMAHMRVQLSTTTPLISPYTDGTDDGKIVYFSGSSNTGIETTLNVTITLPTIASGPGGDGFLRRLYVGNFNNGGEGETSIDIASSGKFTGGLTKIELEADGASVMLVAIKGCLLYTSPSPRD